MATVSILYRFALPDGSREEFDLRLDGTTVALRQPAPAAMPPWTALELHQCPHCPLRGDEHPHCPAAANLVAALPCFARLVSYEKVRVEVVMDGRTVSQDTTAQVAFSSLMGLLVATSACPHMALFRPMARFHQPLGGEEETIYRAASTYLLGQYFLARDGRPADLGLEGLARIYRDVEVVNMHLARRLREASQADCPTNALILLDMYAKAMPSIVEDCLQELRPLFEPFLARAGGEERKT